ncbi:MAG: enoyl-CoA hydratase/isomerase family protein [Deltaproteobacteria bacterium HGW-Deltaproteobacteria-13]|jgi:enoyl-CoA hydratase/carnithine racemase|nr:MAG: enoyl-CoA hydratase/isomerase family protein [Deltaproteobacteria bacterium HGW-Deltaproteobacteria-13]
MDKWTYFSTRREKSTLWVEMKNPPVNFLTVAMLEELFALLKQVSKDDSVRVFILTGGIEDVYIMHFSIPELLTLSTDNKKLLLNLFTKTKLTGAILKYVTTSTNWLMDYFGWYETLMLKIARAMKGYSSSLYLWFIMQRVYFAIERLNKITVAAINGNCNGGGTELSACFDFRFMIGDQGFTLGQPEVLINIVPGGGSTQRLPRLIGRAKALEFMLRGNQMNPEEAQRIGLITGFFNKAEFKAKVQEFADLMSKRPMTAVDAIKKCVHDGMETTLRHGLSIEMEQSIRCLDTEDTINAMQAYIRYLDEHINSIDRQKITTGELNRIVQETVKHMEEGKLYKFKH